MVPTDYRLDEVCARLVPRLEASRRSFRDPQRAREAFAELARKHVQAAIGEYRSVVGDDRHLSRQAQLLEEEVVGTFLPRYAELALERNRAETDTRRLEAWGDPARRLVLVGLAVAVWFVGFRFIGRPLAWLPLLFAGSAPFWPDLADRVARRRHRAGLQAIVDDMQQIQDQATSYLPPELLAVEEPRRPPSTERQTP